MDITLFRKLFLCQMIPILKRIEGGIHFRESVYPESPLFVYLSGSAKGVSIESVSEWLAILVTTSKNLIIHFYNIFYKKE